jgi:hypothetical protein
MDRASVRLIRAGTGANALRFPAVGSIGIVTVVAIEEWANAAKSVVKAITGKAAADMASAIAAEAATEMAAFSAKAAAAEAATAMTATAEATAHAATAAASKRIIGDACASEG